MALAPASTCQCDSCYIPIIPKPKTRDRHHTAVLSSDFARRNTAPTTIIDKYGRPVIEGMDYWPADRAVLIADYEEMRLRKVVRRDTQGTSDGESYEQELLQDIQSWVLENKEELAFDVDIRSDEEKLAEQREQEERFRLAMERCYANVRKLSDEGGMEPGRYFNSIDDCDEETRRRIVPDPNGSDCSIICGSSGSEELDARRRTAALARKLFDHFDPQPGDSEPAGPLEVPYEDPVYPFLFDTPAKAPPDKALSRLSLVKAQLESRPPPLVVPNIQCRKRPCLFHLAQLLTSPSMHAEGRGCVHDGCKHVSRTKEEWKRHAVTEHHVEWSRRETRREDWGEGGTCCA